MLALIVWKIDYQLFIMILLYDQFVGLKPDLQVHYVGLKDQLRSYFVSDLQVQYVELKLDLHKQTSYQ